MWIRRCRHLLMFDLTDRIGVDTTQVETAHRNSGMTSVASRSSDSVAG